jgi:SAM-dependent methyltransferase
MALWSLFRQKKVPTPFSTWERTPPIPPPTLFFDEDNRRHRADAPYLLPKDGQEVNRLNYQHYIFRQILQGNCFAPVHDLLQRGGTVLDSGCGTGRWGDEIARGYPQVQVMNFDL